MIKTFKCHQKKNVELGVNEILIFCSDWHAHAPCCEIYLNGRLLSRRVV